MKKKNTEQSKNRLHWLTVCGSCKHSILQQHVWMSSVVMVTCGQWSGVQWQLHNDEPSEHEWRESSSHAGLVAALCPWGWWGGWTKICFGRYSNLGQSEAGREWPHCSYIIIISPVCYYAGTQGDPAPGNTSNSPLWQHVCTHTCTYTHLGERKRSYDSPELRGQRLPLQMAHSHVQPFNRRANHTLSHKQSDTEPVSPAVLHDYTSHGLRFHLLPWSGPHFLIISVFPF